MLLDKKILVLVVTFASAAALADRPPQHAELRMAINLGKYDQAREYIKQGVKDIYCGDMPADSAKAVWAKRWKQNPELALTGCLPQYTHFYPEKACEIRGVSPNICPGRLKDSTTLADPKRFAALAKAALSNPEHKTRLRGEIAALGEERLIVLADEARFDFVRDSVLPEKMAAWAGMLRDLQRKFKLFGDGEKDYYPGSEKWMKSERARERITSYRKRKAAADAGQSQKLLQKAPTRGDSEGQVVHMLKIVEVVDYTPTGRRIVVYSDGAPTTPQFTGKEMDAETGLYHFGARQYDSQLGLWAQVDPGRQFASPYAYAGNGVNPIVTMDDEGGKIRFADNVSDAFKEEFALAISYMNEGGVSGIFARLEARPEMITIRSTWENGGRAQMVAESADHMTIYWNPYMALDFSSNGSSEETQTPALGLFHEACHAERCIDNFQRCLDARHIKVPLFDNPEDMAIITGPEKWAAEKLGESVRNSHSGSGKPVMHSNER